MEIRINFKAKWASAEGLDVTDAGWLGFKFARDYGHLVNEGWRISFWLRRPLGNLANFSEPVKVEPTAYEVAKLIRAGPKKCFHSCCCERCHGEVQCCK